MTSAVASFEQTLAFEDRHDPRGDADLLDDGGRDGVGRADDRAQGDASGEAKAGDEPGEDEAEQHGADYHQEHREASDGGEFAPELHGWHRDRG